MKYFKICVLLLLIFTLVFSYTYISFADDSVYVWSTMSKPVEDESISTNAETNENSDNSTNLSNSNTTNNTSSTTATNTNESDISSNSLNLESGSAILIEQTTGKVLYSLNEHEKLRPASVTKVMSILLIMEALDSGRISLTDTVPCSENAASMGGSQIWLDTRETLTVDEMLKAICVASANDRCSCNGRIYCRF